MESTASPPSHPHPRDPSADLSTRWRPGHSRNAPPRAVVTPTMKSYQKTRPNDRQPASHRSTSFHTPAGPTRGTAAARGVSERHQPPHGRSPAQHAASFPGPGQPGPLPLPEYAERGPHDPTRPFRVCSGDPGQRAACNHHPTTATTPRATAASLIAARPIVVLAGGPNVYGMNTTSAPPQYTLKDRVNATIPWTHPRRPPGAALAAATWRA